MQPSVVSSRGDPPLTDGYDPNTKRCLQICRVVFFFPFMAVRGVITEADENSCQEDLTQTVQ